MTRPPMPMPTPPVTYAQTPLQAAPFTPSVPALPLQSPAPSVQSEAITTTPPSSSIASRPSTAAEPLIPAAAEVSEIESMVPPKAKFEPPVGLAVLQLICSANYV
jgi:hypothetical protein